MADQIPPPCVQVAITGALIAEPLIDRKAGGLLGLREMRLRILRRRVLRLRILRRRVLGLCELWLGVLRLRELRLGELWLGVLRLRELRLGEMWLSVLQLFKPWLLIVRGVRKRQRCKKGALQKPHGESSSIYFPRLFDSRGSLKRSRYPQHAACTAPSAGTRAIPLQHRPSQAQPPAWPGERRQPDHATSNTDSSTRSG